MVELFTKFRPFLKPINMDKKTCPHPQDEVMEIIKPSKKVKEIPKSKKKHHQRPQKNNAIGRYLGSSLFKVCLYGVDMEYN
jgi:hypothetical protein